MEILLQSKLTMHERTHAQNPLFDTMKHYKMHNGPTSNSHIYATQLLRKLSKALDSSFSWPKALMMQNESISLSMIFWWNWFG